MVTLTEKQKEAAAILTDPNARHVLLYGGGRSGKTFLTVDIILSRAMKCPESRHAFIRKYLSSLKMSVWRDTLPKICRMHCTDEEGVFNKYMYNKLFKWNQNEMILTLANGSEIYFFGLDNDERADKILGTEYCTMSFEEVNEIPEEAIQTAVSRLAQKNDLTNRVMYTMNPPNKFHWTYRTFVQGKDADGKELHNRHWYRHFRMNPRDNLENIDEVTMAFYEGMTPKKRKRFLDGEFQDDTGEGVLQREWLKYTDICDLPELSKVVVAVDPIISDSSRSDLCGIVVCALGEDGNFFVLADETLRGEPLKWATKVVTLYNDFEANYVVYESNQGGLLVEEAIHNVDKRVPCKGVRAFRSKTLRADAVAVLYHKGAVLHSREFELLEDEFCNYNGEGPSPNRMDAAVYGLLELSQGPRLLSPSVKPEPEPEKESYWLNPENDALWESA